MTLTSLLPSLRRTIPDPITHDRWPEGTVATTSDVVVAGISLLRLVEVCGTPCVHSGAAVVPGTGGRPSDTAKTAVLVVRITAVAVHASGVPVVATDARLDHLRLLWSEMRLIARVSTAHSGAVLIAERSGDADFGLSADVSSVVLPLDLRVGDLLAVPSRPIETTWSLSPHPLTGTDAAPGADSMSGTDSAPGPGAPLRGLYGTTSRSFRGSQPSWLSELA